MVPENAQVVRLLHVGFQRIGHADHRRGANTRARMHHLLDLVESETRMLHLEPREIVMRRHLAILLGVERALRMAEHLLARQQLGLGGVVELSIRILHERPGSPAPWPAGIQRYRSQGAIGVLRRRAAALRARPRHRPHQRQHESAANSCSEHVPLLFEFWKARVCHESPCSDVQWDDSEFILKRTRIPIRRHHERNMERNLERRTLLLLIRDDQIAVFVPVGIQRFRVADRMHAGRRRFDERVVR